jgi:acyl dehydratase
MEYKPIGKTFEEFEVGAEFVTASRTIIGADIGSFAGLSGDFNPIHMNEEFAKTTPLKGRIAHGMLVASIATGLGNQLRIFEGTTLAVMSINNKFKGIVRPQDTITLVLKVREKKETSKPDRGIVIFDANIHNQRDEVVIEGEWVVMMMRKA